MTGLLWLSDASPLFFYSPIATYFAGTTSQSSWIGSIDPSGASPNNTYHLTTGSAGVILPSIYGMSSFLTQFAHLSFSSDPLSNLSYRPYRECVRLTKRQPPASRLYGKNPNLQAIAPFLELAHRHRKHGSPARITLILVISTLRHSP